MKYIASCSFGKDSLAMILTIIEHGLPLDEVVYCEVMFDDATSGEYPEHAAFIHDKAIPILELVYGLKVRVLRHTWNYKNECFRLRKKGKYEGTPVGFPMRRGPWCNKMKIHPIRDYRKEQTDEVHEYVGIAIDEPERLARLTPNKSSPLADYGITEARAMDLCREHYLLSPIYQTQARNGCWFCHNARLNELHDLWKNHPNLWAELRCIQAISRVSFKQDYTIFDLEERFKKEEAQHEKAQETPAPGKAPDV